MMMKIPLNVPLVVVLIMISSPTMAAARSRLSAILGPVQGAQAQPSYSGSMGTPLRAAPKPLPARVEIIVSPDGRNVTLKITSGEGKMTIRGMAREGRQKGDVAARDGGTAGINLPVRP